MTARAAFTAPKIHDRPLKVAMMAYPEVASIDVSGPLDAFVLANMMAGRRLYDPFTFTVDAAPITVAGGFLTLHPNCGCEDLPDRIDLLLVAGGPGAEKAACDEQVLSCLRELEPRCARMGAVCTGSTVLAATGLLKGCRIATHWLEALRLDAAPAADRIAELEVDADAIFVVSGKFWTSAGMLAGIDLALALIEEDFGRKIALDVARFLVLAQRRGGGQSQFGSYLVAESTDDQRIRKVQRHIIDDPGGDLSLGLLAEHAAMSKRSLVRRFKEVTNSTVFRYIEDVRLRRARQLLETTSHPIQTVAFESGFGTAATLRRVFKRRLGVSPSSYGADFGPKRLPDRDDPANAGALEAPTASVAKAPGA